MISTRGDLAVARPRPRSPCARSVEQRRHGRYTGAGSSSSLDRAPTARSAACSAAISRCTIDLRARFRRQREASRSGAVASTSASGSKGGSVMRSPPRTSANGRRPSDDGALRADHVERRRLEGGKVARGRVLDQQAFVAAVVGLAHRGLHADFGRDAGEDELGDAARLQDLGDVGGVEHALAGLVDHDLAGRGRAGRRRSARRARRAPGCAPSARRRRCAATGVPRARLAGGQSDRSGRWHSRVCRIVQPLSRKAPISAATVGTICDHRREIVAERLAEAAGLEEVALHVDHDERRARRIEAEGEGLCRRPRSSFNAPPCGGRWSCGRRRRVGEVGDLAARHHRDAVGELEDFVEVLARPAAPPRRGCAAP